MSVTNPQTEPVDIEVGDSVQGLEHLETVADTESKNIEVVIDNQQITAVLEPERKRIKLTTTTVALPEQTDTLGIPDCVYWLMQS